MWFYRAPTQLRSYSAETSTMILANLGCYNFNATPGVKTILPAGAKRCIESSYSNPFSRLLRSRRDKQWIQFWCLNPWRQALSDMGINKVNHVALNNTVSITWFYRIYLACLTRVESFNKNWNFTPRICVSINKAYDTICRYCGIVLVCHIEGVIKTAIWTPLSMFAKSKCHHFLTEMLNSAYAGISWRWR
jgi:hypothetical protein